MGDRRQIFQDSVEQLIPQDPFLFRAYINKSVEIKQITYIAF